MPPIEHDTILKRMNGIQGEVAELEKLGALPFVAFRDGDGYKLAQYHLHRALEGIFNIGSHILARIPGGEATQYKEIALKLGAYGIVPKEFAETTLVKMAKYRNRLVHFYAEVTPAELYDIIRNHLDDFNTLLAGVKAVLAHPDRFGLQAE